MHRFVEIDEPENNRVNIANIMELTGNDILFSRDFSLDRQGNPINRWTELHRFHNQGKVYREGELHGFARIEAILQETENREKEEKELRPKREKMKQMVDELFPEGVD